MTMMVMMMTMPPLAQPHSPQNPANLVTPYCECKLEPRLNTSFEEADRIMNTSATPSTAMPLTTTMTMMPMMTTTPTTQITLPMDKLLITASTYQSTQPPDSTEDQLKLWHQSMVLTDILLDHLDQRLQALTVTWLIVKTVAPQPTLTPPGATIPDAKSQFQPPSATTSPQLMWIPPVPPALDTNSPNNLPIQATTGHQTQQPTVTTNLRLPPPPAQFPLLFHHKNILANLHHQPHPSPSF